MLPLLEANPTLKGAEHPRRALLGCGRVLRTLGDPRGSEILATAHARLQEQAAQIADGAALRMFLENVPEKRELVAELARLKASQVVPAAGTMAQPPAPAEKEEGPPDRAGKRKKGKKEKGKGKGQEQERGKRGKKKAR